MDFEQFSKQYDKLYCNKSEEDKINEVQKPRSSNQSLVNANGDLDEEISKLIEKEGDRVRHYIPQNLQSYTFNIYTRNGEETKQTSMKILKEKMPQNDPVSDDREIGIFKKSQFLF